MGKKVYIVVILILGVIGIMVISNALKKDDSAINESTNESQVQGKRKSGEPVEISSLKELFPSRIGETYKYKEGDNEYKEKVKDVEETENGTKVVTSRDVKDESGTYEIETIYEIEEEKVVMSGRHIKYGETVSTIYAEEIISNGLPYVGKTWESIDGLTKYEVTKMENKKVEIKSTIGESSITRVIELGKGIVEVK